MYPEPFTTALAPIFKDFLSRGIKLPCIFQRVGAKISDRTLFMNFEDFENKIELFFILSLWCCAKLKEPINFVSDLFMA